jgi:hypothetical protein
LDLVVAPSTNTGQPRYLRNVRQFEIKVAEAERRLAQREADEARLSKLLARVPETLSEECQFALNSLLPLGEQDNGDEEARYAMDDLERCLDAENA